MLRQAGLYIVCNPTTKVWEAVPTCGQICPPICASPVSTTEFQLGFGWGRHGFMILVDDCDVELSGQLFDLCHEMALSCIASLSYLCGAKERDLSIMPLFVRFVC
jgi:hypothetical protein